MDNSWLDLAVSKIKKKMPFVVARSEDKIPYTTKDGVFDDWTDKDINRIFASNIDKKLF